MPSVTVYIPSNKAIAVVGTGTAVSQEEALIKLDEKTGASANYDFTGIVAGYRHLVLEVYVRSDNASTTANLQLQFNGDTTSNYDWQHLDASATGTGENESFAASSINVGLMPAASAGAGLFSVHRITIPNYAGTTGNKGLHSETACKIGTSTGNIQLDYHGGFWRSPAAITEVKLTPSAGAFVAGSIVTLYAEAS